MGADVEQDWMERKFATLDAFEERTIPHVMHLHERNISFEFATQDTKGLHRYAAFLAVHTRDQDLRTLCGRVAAQVEMGTRGDETTRLELRLADALLLRREMIKLLHRSNEESVRQRATSIKDALEKGLESPEHRRSL